MGRCVGSSTWIVFWAGQWERRWRLGHWCRIDKWDRMKIKSWFQATGFPISTKNARLFYNNSTHPANNAGERLHGAILMDLVTGAEINGYIRICINSTVPEISGCGWVSKKTSYSRRDWPNPSVAIEASIICWLLVLYTLELYVGRKAYNKLSRHTFEEQHDILSYSSEWRRRSD